MIAPPIFTVGIEERIANQLRLRDGSREVLAYALPTHVPLDGPAPLAVVVDVALPGALDAVREWRARWPQSLIAGSIAVPSRDAWSAAEAAGCDFVSNRGALAIRLKEKLAGWGDRPRVRRLRLFGLQDVAGRLGVVHRLVDEVSGPIAVYHVRGSLFAIADTCPHAGRLLSEGTVEETVVTCPGHGSQFDVRNGARVRGPGDVDVPSFRVVIEDQEVFLELDQRA